MAKLTKKQAQELNNKIVEIAESFGADEWLSLNTKYPHTGKWNFHLWAEQVDVMPGYFEREIERITNG